MFTTVGLPKITWAKPVTMRFRLRKCHTFGSKLWEFWVVSAMVLGRNSRGVGYVGQRTTDNGGRWPVGLRQDNETTSGAAATCRLVVSWSAKRKRSIMR